MVSAVNESTDKPSPLTSYSIQPAQERSRNISWSKNGIIAYTAPTYNSKHNLFLTYLENIDGRSWQLAKPQGLLIRPTDHCETPQLSLILWSNLSTDLAICDHRGNFYILLAGVGLLNKDGKGISENESLMATKPPSDPKSPGHAANSPSYELTSYNHTEMIYCDLVKSNTESEFDSRSRIISLKWLNIEKPQIINKPAVLSRHEPVANGQQKTPLAYSYSVNQYHSYGMTHPIATKQACVALRENGEFVLYYQGEHKVEYHKVAIPLSKDTVSLTTGSIGFDNKRIIVSAFDSYLGKIFTYEIDIDWGFLVESSKKQKVDPHYHTPKEAQKLPKLSLKILNEMNTVSLYNIDVPEKKEDAMEIDDEAGASTKDVIELGKLASIDIVSPNFDKETKLFILVSYKFEDVQQNIEKTTIYRYAITKSQELISEAFSDLGMRKNVSKTGESQIYNLLLQDKLTRPKYIQSIETFIAESYILLTYEDGTIETLDRKTLKILTVHKDSDPPETIATVYDFGYLFPKIERKSKNPLLICVSPNLTSVVYAEVNDPSQQLTMKVVEKVNTSNISPKELFITSVGFAFRHAFSCYTNTCSDDLIALIQSEVKRIGAGLYKTAGSKSHNVDTILNRFIESTVCESHKAINFQLDAFGKESVDKLLSNPPLQKLLSLQLVLGEIQTKNHVISDIAWVVLNLRSTSFGIMFSLSSIYRQISKKKPAEDSLQDSITRAECIMSLIGNVKWLIDLMIYLNQELLQLSYMKNNQTESKLNYKNSIVLPIILSKVPRLFLMYAWSSIGKTHEILKKLHKDLSESNKLLTPMKEALNRYFAVCKTSPLNLSISENFLRECDAYVTKELGALATNKDRGYTLKIEQKLVCQGELSEELITIAKALIDRHTISINRDMKVSELFFYDVDWIDVGVTRQGDESTSSNFVTDRTPVIHHTSGKYKSTIRRPKYSVSEGIDALRKIVIEVGLKLDSKPDTTIVTQDADNKLAKLRKCTRCRSVSLVTDPLVFDASSTIGLWTMVFQRTCICGSAWVNCE